MNSLCIVLQPWESALPMKLEFHPYGTGVSYLWHCSFTRMALEFPTYETVGTSEDVERFFRPVLQYGTPCGVSLHCVQQIR